MIVGVCNMQAPLIFVGNCRGYSINAADCNTERSQSALGDQAPPDYCPVITLSLQSVEAAYYLPRCASLSGRQAQTACTTAVSSTQALPIRRGCRRSIEVGQVKDLNNILQQYRSDDGLQDGPFRHRDPRRDQRRAYDPQGRCDSDGLIAVQQVMALAA
jgi:hypothetical protein